MKSDLLLQNLSKEIRMQRHSQGYSQEELAFRANIDRSYLSEIETGKKNPSLLIFVALADALEISPQELIKRIQ